MSVPVCASRLVCTRAKEEYGLRVHFVPDVNRHRVPFYYMGFTGSCDCDVARAFT